MKYVVRREGLKLEESRASYLKSLSINVPTQELSDLLPNRGVRLALHHGRGNSTQCVTPAMVSVYLVPRNGEKKKESVLIETVILAYGDNASQLTPRPGWWEHHPTVKDVREAMPDYLIGGILSEYVQKVRVTPEGYRRK